MLAFHEGGRLFRWRSTGFTEIRCGGVACGGHLISQDGNVVIVYLGEETRIWTDANGAVPFTAAVIAAGARLGEWQSLSVFDMTPDARVFIGEASSADGRTTTYRLVVPAGTF